MPGKQARALCPVCQEPMAPDATDCGNCGAFVIDEAVVRLSRAFGIDREKALALFEAGFRRPEQLRGRDVDGVLERKETGLLFLCTNCGGFVATGDPTCPRCGAEFEADEETEPAWAGEDADILDLILCPICGADNTPDWTECEICGEPLRAETPRVSRAMPPSAPAPAEPPRTSRVREEPVAPRPAPLELPPIDPRPPDRVAPKAVEKAAPAPAPPPRETRPPMTAVPLRPKPAPAAAPEPPRPPAPREPATQAPQSSFPPSSPSRPPDRPRPREPVRAWENEPEPPAKDRVVKRPAEIRLGPRTAARRPPAGSSRRPAPMDFAGPAILGAGASLYVSYDLGIEGMFWALALLLTGFVGFSLARLSPSGRARIRQREGLLLVLGGTAGGLGPLTYGGPVEAAYVLAAASAFPMAYVARAVVDTPQRPILAAAGAVPLIALAIAAGQGVPDAARLAWTIGILAALLGPAAALLGEARQRGYLRDLRRELVRAERDLDREDFRGSVESYDRAIALTEKADAGADLPWYGKGASLILLGRYDEALRAIDRALDLNPRNEVAWVNKGNAYTKMGRLVDALRCFNAAIKVNPRYEVAWNNKGNALARLGRYEDALRCYERALEIDPSYRGAWVNKGYVLAKLGRFDEAASCADRVLRLRPGRGADAA